MCQNLKQLTDGISLNLISIIISFASFMVAFLALYMTVLKRGKLQIYPLVREDDVEINSHSKYDNKPITFNIGIPIIAKNTGSKTITIGRIRYKIINPDIFEYKIIYTPKLEDVSNQSLCVLPPYEVKSGLLGIWFEIKGHGRGFTEDFKQRINNLEVSLENAEIKLCINYTSYEETRTVNHEHCFDIKHLIKKVYQE